MSDLEKKAYRMLKEFLRGENKSIDKIKEAIDIVLEMSIFKDSNKDEIKNIIYDEYITNIGIINPDAEFLVKDKDFNNWMKSLNKTTSHFDRYIDYLRDQDFPEDSLDKMTKSTNDILARCADPNNLSDSKNSKKKGLVMGDIQSGKTANYMALINMACDYDYKLIIVLAGLTDSLRCQLPEGTDGTGYWTITIRALGYENATYKFKATDENIVKGDDAVQDTSKLEAAIKEAEGLSADDYTEDSWKSMQLELAEAKEELANPHTQSTVDEATEHLNAAIKALVKAENEQATYVLMNIPYDKFYAAEGDDDADAVTSATLNKTRSSLAAGSYHVNSDGSDITGIVYPVKLSDASALEKLTQVTDSSKVDITVSMKGKETTTTYEGKDALFESASYSYYVLSEAPSYYKEATVNEDGTLSFGKVKGTEAKTLSGVTAEFSTSSRYGDYQINLSGLPDDITTVYGVVVGTKEGSNYGMRHLENIWRISELAWSTGFVTTAHGSPLQ